MSAKPDCRRHRRRRFHRQPHGRRAARARLPRARDRQSGRRPRTAISPTTRRIRTCRSRRAIFATSSPARRLFRGAQLRVSLRRHRRHRAVDRAADRIHVDANVQGTVHVLECARARERAQVRLRGVVVLLRPRRDADARGSSDRAAISLRALEVPGRAGGLPLAQVYRLPVNSIRIFNAYGTRVRTTGAYGAVFGVFLQAEARRQAVHGRRRRHARRAISSTSPMSPRRFGWPRKPTRPARSGTSAPAIRSRSTGWSSCSAARWCTFRSGPASRTAPGPTSRRSRAISAGSRRCPSRKACA